MTRMVIVESPYSPGPKPTFNCSFRALRADEPAALDAASQYREASRIWEETLRANVSYARACLADCLRRGEAPFASHLLYTQDGVLDDTIPEQREQGIAAGLAIAERADATVVYFDRGISKGMAKGIKHAMEHRRTIEPRLIRSKVDVEAAIVSFHDALIPVRAILPTTRIIHLDWRYYGH